MGRFVRIFLVSFHRLRLQDPPAPRRAVKTFMSHLNAAGLSAFVTQLLLQKLQVSLSNAIAFLRDSAAVNGAAVHTLSTTFNGARPERAV